MTNHTFVWCIIAITFIVLALIVYLIFKNNRKVRSNANNFETVKNVSSVWEYYLNCIDGLKHLPMREILNTKNGTEIISEEFKLKSYIAAYGAMHYHKLRKAFEILIPRIKDSNVIEIIDYGCGQAIASITLLEFISENNLDIKIGKHILIEPSTLALNKGSYIVKNIIDNNLICTVNKKLNDLEKKDLRTDRRAIKIHLFSNVLDVNDINLSDLSKVIKVSQKGSNFFVCISPKNENAGRNITNFKNNFRDSCCVSLEDNNISGKVFNFYNHKWTDNYQITRFQLIFYCKL